MLSLSPFSSGHPHFASVLGTRSCTYYLDVLTFTNVEAADKMPQVAEEGVSRQISRPAEVTYPPTLVEEKTHKKSQGSRKPWGLVWRSSIWFITLGLSSICPRYTLVAHASVYDDPIISCWTG